MKRKTKIKKLKPSYYKFQIQKTKTSKWTTPVIREWGIKTPNKFKSKMEARKVYWRAAQTSQAKKIYDARIKGFRR